MTRRDPADPRRGRYVYLPARTDFEERTPAGGVWWSFGMSGKRKGPTPRKRRLKLAVIPEPAPNTRSVLILDAPGTILMKGEEAPNLLLECGSCGAPLIVGVRTSNVQNLVFKCNGCGSFNETIE